MPWHVVVPVKPAESGKSRLGASPELARAVAVDTVSAIAATPEVERVVVVTADETVAWELRSIEGVEVVAELAAGGIGAAVSLGLDMLEEESGRAAILGDLPALRPEDLSAALGLASRVDRGFVPDREGGGTTMVSASGGVELLSRFGDGSAARHAALGIVRLNVPKDSTLRRDVDTPEQLDAAALLGLGPRTSSALAAPRPLPRHASVPSSPSDGTQDAPRDPSSGHDTPFPPRA